MQLFEAVTTEARLKHWFLEGAVADTIDGRFAVLASVLALVFARLEQLDDEGNVLSVNLTERFIEVMESEHRELGLGDPTLGKTVRRLVGSLASRVELMRSAALSGDWIESAQQAIYRGSAVSADALGHSGSELQRIWSRLCRLDIKALREGRLR